MGEGSETGGVGEMGFDLFLTVVVEGEAALDGS